jgi:iron(II)-dependent oxidoreductase
VNSTALFTLLSDYQQKVLELCEEHPEDYNIQYHPDLSPLGWHLGHCVYTETHWIRDQVFGISSPDQKLKTHYVPELAYKSGRAGALPDHAELCQWARERQQENLGLIKNDPYPDNHPLVQHDFIFHFLIQHYAQHFEIMHMILVQKALQDCDDFEVTQPLFSSELKFSTALIEGGSYIIGSQTDFLPYDNEYPCHEFKTGDINIADKPVSNSEFLLFMEQSGYQTREYWSLDGWQWQQKKDVSCPEFWVKDKRQNWFGIDIKGPHHLDPDHPVWGLNHYEAQAFTNWASLSHGQARLPHEYEWEAAKQNDRLKNTGLVWEWCQNSFHPYANFRAFPYDGYSNPYFDGSHFVMKGAGRYTKEVIRRSSFRNYYQADKRYQFAGCRLVFD